MRSDTTLAVVRLVAGQAQNLFGIIDLVVLRNDDVVGDDIVMERTGRRARKTEPVDDDRSRTQCDQPRAAFPGIAVYVDQDLDTVFGDQPRGSFVVDAGNGAPVVGGFPEIPAERIIRRRAAIIGEDLDLGPLMQAEHFRHQVADGMFAKIGRQVTDPQRAVVLHGLWPCLHGGGGRSDVLAAVVGAKAKLKQRVVAEGRRRQGRHGPHLL